MSTIDWLCTNEPVVKILDVARGDGLSARDTESEICAAASQVHDHSKVQASQVQDADMYVDDQVTEARAHLKDARAIKISCTRGESRQAPARARRARQRGSGVYCTRRLRVRCGHSATEARATHSLDTASTN